MDESLYKVKIEGDGLIFEREVSRGIGEKILILILSGANQPVIPFKSSDVLPIAPPENSLTQHKHHSDLSIREFLDEHNAKRNPDIITAIGLYLSDHGNQPEFTREDILSAFEAAAEPTPKNYSRDLKWTIKIGWVAEKRGMKDTYYVTSSGKNAVNTLFPDDLIKKTKVRPNGKKASIKKIQENEA